MARLAGLGVAAAALLASSVVIAVPTSASADALQIFLPPTSTPASPPTPPDFVGFSLEVNNAPVYLAFPNGTARPSFGNLMRLIQRCSGGRGPNVRVGGGSSDNSALIPPSTPLPPNITYRITPADVAALVGAAPLWNGTLTLGTNFRYPNASAAWGAAHVAAMGAATPWSSGVVEAVEIGNEVDIYPDNGFRLHNYSAEDYADEFADFAAALHAAGLPVGRLQGATYAEDLFYPGLDSYMARFAAQKELSSVSLHEYAVGHCEGKNISIWDLLAPQGVYSAHFEMMAAFLGPARALGVPLLVGEGGTASCGGQPGVSDVFAAALWALDAFSAHAQLGFARFNSHGGGTPPSIAHYSPIGYTNVTADTPVVRPVYMGLWAFAAATRRGAVVLNATLAASPAAAGAYISAWAFRDATGEERVLAIHKDGNATGAATVSVVPAAAAAEEEEEEAGERGESGGVGGAATLFRLTAAAGGIHAPDGISLAGFTFDGSLDGTPSGALETEAVPLGSDGRYTFELPVGSAALLILPGGGGGGPAGAASVCL
jgi:hypothetical protein